MRENECKHLTGAFTNSTCAAGVNYNDVIPDPDKPGRLLRLPCRSYDGDEHAAKCHALHGPPGTCDKYEEPTAEEVAAHNKAVEEAIAKDLLCIPLIAIAKSACVGKRAVSKEFDCPACEDGTLTVEVSGYNMHTRGRCSTAECVSWIE